MDSLGRLIRKARRDKDWTQRELAERLTRRLGRRISVSAVAQWEIGIRRPRPDALAALVEELELPREFLDAVPDYRALTTAALGRELAQVLGDPEVRQALTSPDVLRVLARLPIEARGRPVTLVHLRALVNRLIATHGRKVVKDHVAAARGSR
jgi:transcriptional regulator with XRE-family HTH domain